MEYTRADAKSYAMANMNGIWAAAQMPFTSDHRIDEDGFRHNVAHWTQELGIEGLFISGKRGEFFSMSVDERKRSFELAVEATGDDGYTIMSCSDANFDVVLDLARHAQQVGADYIVVHAPALHFHSAHDETLMGYYGAVAEAVDIGIALWSHPASGYLMSPQLINRLADLETVCLLYTSPSPRDATLSRMPSSA